MAAAGRSFLGLVAAAACINAVAVSGMPANSGEYASRSEQGLSRRADSSSPKVILKLDDVLNLPTVMSQFEHVRTILEDQNIKASFGVITRTIEGLKENSYFCHWLRDLQGTDLIEIWNHGLDHVRGEFDSPLEDQKKRLEQARDLLAVCGITAKVFGAPFNENNDQTGQALHAIGSFDAWFFPQTDENEEPSIVSFPPSKARCDMEVTRAGEISFDYFKENYERMRDEPVLVLQGHPGHWDTMRMTEFLRIITFLKSEGATFMTPGEWVSEGRHVTLEKPSSDAVGPSTPSAASSNATAHGVEGAVDEALALQDSTEAGSDSNSTVASAHNTAPPVTNSTTPVPANTTVSGNVASSSSPAPSAQLGQTKAGQSSPLPVGANANAAAGTATDAAGSQGDTQLVPS